jgi:predicted porin
MTGSGRNTSLGGSMGLNYTLREVHSFSFSASYNRYVSTNIVEELYRPSNRNSDIMCSLSYNYTFNALSIKRQTEEAMKGNNKKYLITSDFSKSARDERRLKALGGPRK